MPGQPVASWRRWVVAVSDLLREVGCSSEALRSVSPAPADFGRGVGEAGCRDGDESYRWLRRGDRSGDMACGRAGRRYKRIAPGFAEDVGALPSSL